MRRILDYYSTDRLVDDLVDIVSKNGCLLLNIAPHPDGTIPAEQQERLREHWPLAADERPGDLLALGRGKVFGEGPTKTPQGHLADLHFDGFIRPGRPIYTQSKDKRKLYAIALGWPRDGTLSP